MSRKIFASLPAKAQGIIRKYSGEWAVARSNEFFEDVNAKSMEQLKTDPNRMVIFPSEAEIPRIEAASRKSSTSGMGKNARNHDLLEMAKAEIKKCVIRKLPQCSYEVRAQHIRAKPCWKLAPLSNRFWILGRCGVVQPALHSATNYALRGARCIR